MTNPFVYPDNIAQTYEKLNRPRVDEVKVDEPLFATIGKHSLEEKKEDQTPVVEAIVETVPEYGLKVYDNFSSSHSSKELNSPRHREVHSAWYAPSGPDGIDDHAIDEYCKSSFSVNTVLHKIHQGQRVDLGINYHEVKNLDDVFDKHKSKVPTTVYSGIHINPMDVFDKHRDENGNVPEHIVIHHPAYLSTSSSPEIAQSFAAGINNLDKPHNHEDHPVRNNAQTPDKRARHVKHVLMLHVPEGTHGVSASGGHYDSGGGRQ